MKYFIGKIESVSSYSTNRKDTGARMDMVAVVVKYNETAQEFGCENPEPTTIRITFNSGNHGYIEAKSLEPGMVVQWVYDRLYKKGGYINMEFDHMVVATSEQAKTAKLVAPVVEEEITATIENV